jgi:phosphatidylglycerol:prolipoprotein diacylglycerol transferase
LLNLMLCTALTLLVLHQDKFRWYRSGMAFGLYILTYGVVRLILERIRTDSLYIGPLPAAYWLSFAMIAIGLFVILLRRFPERG